MPYIGSDITKMLFGRYSFITKFQKGIKISLSVNNTQDIVQEPEIRKSEISKECV